MQLSVTSSAARCLVVQRSRAVAGQEWRCLAQHLLLSGCDGNRLNVDVVIVVPAITYSNIRIQYMKTFARAVANILKRQREPSTHMPSILSFFKNVRLLKSF